MEKKTCFLLIFFIFLSVNIFADGGDTYCKKYNLAPESFSKQLHAIHKKHAASWKISAERMSNPKMFHDMKILQKKGVLDYITIIDPPLEAAFDNSWMKFLNLVDKKNTVSFIILFQQIFRDLFRFYKKIIFREDTLDFLIDTPNAVFTISSATIRTKQEIQKRILEASNFLEARHLLFVSGGGIMRKTSRYFGNELPVSLNTFKMLEIANQLKKSRKIPQNIEFWATANPNIIKTNDPVMRIRKKINLGASTILTNPPFIWDNFESWWKAAFRDGLTQKANIRVGIPLITSLENLKRWLVLTGINPFSPQAANLIADFEKAEQNGSFEQFSKEWSLNLIRKIKALPQVSGLHLMPLNSGTDLELFLKEAKVTAKQYPHQMHYIFSSQIIFKSS